MPVFGLLLHVLRLHMVEPQHTKEKTDRYLQPVCCGSARAPMLCVPIWYRAAKQKYKSGKYMQIALVYKWGKMHILAVFGGILSKKAPTNGANMGIKGVFASC